MEKSNPLYASYLEILRRELVPAMGCTEPIAIAFAAAKAREVLGALPEAITVTASGNIIKNVKSVIVPNTEGRKGIEVAAAAKDRHRGQSCAVGSCTRHHGRCARGRPHGQRPPC